MDPAEPAQRGLRPYLNLIRSNRDFRLLWTSQVVSNFGDWFGLLALYALIQTYSDSEFLLGLMIVVKMMSLAVFSPIAGYLTDRYDRRWIMIGCDLARAVIVLGLLLVRDADHLWLAYVLTSAQMMLSALFEPAKTSSIPNVTTPGQLVSANILSAASWSIIFTTGMALGGLATGAVGTDAVFLLNSASYLASGWFIWRATVPQTRLDEHEMRRTRNPLTGMAEGFRFLFAQRQILRPALAKGTFTVCSGALVYLLILVAEDVLMMGSIGLGLLYAARGLGTGIGPVIGRRLFRSESSWILAMGLAMIVCGSFYLLLGRTSSLPLMLLFVLVAHAASGVNWVTSTVLLQRRTPDTFRGRVFSSEWLLFTLTQSLSVLLASLALEWGWSSLRGTITLFSAAMVTVGLGWIALVVPLERRYLRSRPSEDLAPG